MAQREVQSELHVSRLTDYVYELAQKLATFYTAAKATRVATDDQFPLMRSWFGTLDILFSVDRGSS